MDEQSGESKEQEVMSKWIGELEIKELVAEWGWQSDDGSCFQKQGEA